MLWRNALPGCHMVELPLVLRNEIFEVFFFFFFFTEEKGGGVAITGSRTW